jgi:hypothetical protein
MKYLVTMLLLAAAPALAAAEKIELTWYEDFPLGMEISYGTFKCTKGGIPVAPFVCSKGGIHIRGMEGYTCLLNENREIVATTWFSLNANWDASYTGPVHGEWKVIMGSDCSKEIALADHDSYLAGTYSGKRKVFPSPKGIPMPWTWYGVWKLDGYGVGDFEGVQFKSINEYETYHPLQFQYEAIPVNAWPGIQGEPEGTIHGLMILEDDE